MAFLFNRKKRLKPKTVILGLDGVPYTLLRDLIHRGDIPHMASIFENGYFGQKTLEKS